MDRKGERAKIPAHFPDPVVRRPIELDLALTGHCDSLLKALEQALALMAKAHDAFAYHLLRPIPGVGRILTRVLRYKIKNIDRFPRAQESLSYARLVKGQKRSAGYRLLTGGGLISVCWLCHTSTSQRLKSPWKNPFLGLSPFA